MGPQNLPRPYYKKKLLVIDLEITTFNIYCRKLRELFFQPTREVESRKKYCAYQQFDWHQGKAFSLAIMLTSTKNYSRYYTMLNIFRTIDFRISEQKKGTIYGCVR